MAQTQSKTPIVFIPGIKGSTLVDSMGRTTWVTTAQAFGISTPDLKLPLDWEGGEQAKDTFQAKTILEHIPILPLLSGKQVYGPWLKLLKNSGRPFQTFPYDWRRDNNETLTNFERFLEKAVHSHGGPLQVVAHSMGGLIALALLQARPQLFQSLVLAGVPIKGGLGFLPDLHTGNAVGLNRHILSPEVFWTHPSVYSLFPLANLPPEFGEKLQSNVFHSGRPIPMNFYAIEDWEAERLGPFRIGNSPSEKFKSFMKNALESARTFRKKIEGLEVPGLGKAIGSFPQVIHIVGNTVPTLAQIETSDFTTKNLGPGDGRVLAASGTSHVVPMSISPSSYIHSDLLNDPGVLSVMDSLV